MRKKRPDLVRRSLIASAARLAVEQGLARVSLQAVADAAEVTKGGLMHHFPSKQALTEAVFGDMLEALDVEIDALMVGDGGFGSFSRAYVNAIFRDGERTDVSAWTALTVSMLTDGRLSGLWADWLSERLRRHVATDHDPALDVARFAADGVWLADLMKLGFDRPSLRTRLIDLTTGGDRP